MVRGNALLSASSKKIDPTLDSLFASSAGPVTAPLTTRYSELTVPKARAEPQTVEDAEEEGGDDDDDEEGQDEGNDEVLSEISEELGDSEEEKNADAVAELAAKVQEPERKQKRKRKQDEFDDLESKYFKKLADDEPPSTKRLKVPAEEEEAKDVVTKEDEDESDGNVIMHESLVQAQTKQSGEIDKANRTVFLSNVSTEAIGSKKAKKTLMAHLASFLDKSTTPPQSLESLRFRSVPFATTAMPKRAAYITGATMDATTHSTNAYAVYSTPAAARTAVNKLNGTVVLERHLRVDSVAHPSQVAHRRCVFVGNLGFVDDETVLNVKVDEEGKEQTEKRKRTKVPMDVEEGLWRTFGKHAGKVESVRVIRDATTRVGKGIAYVQFYDGNSVEAALLLNEKKFPPMLPRTLRVNRCKAPHKTARAMEKKQGEKVAALKASSNDTKRTTKYVPKPTSEDQTMAGRAVKLLGRSAAFRASGKTPARRPGDRGAKPAADNETPSHNGRASLAQKNQGFKTPEAFIFEGRRASSKDAKPKDLKFKQGKGKKKTISRPNKSGR